MPKFLSSLSIFFLFNALNIALPFFLLPFLTEKLTIMEYGTLTMYTAVTAIYSSFVGVNTNSGVGIKFFQLETRELGKYIGSTLIILLISTSIIVLLTFLFQDMLFVFTSLNLKWLLLAISFCFCQFFVQLVLNIWQASSKPFPFGLFQFISIASNLLLVYILISVFKFGWEGRAIAQFVVSFLGAILVLFILIKKNKTILSFKYLKSALDFGVPLIPHSIAGTIFNVADRFFIKSYLSLSSLGIYNLSFQLGSSINIFSDSYNKAMVPVIGTNLKLNTIESLNKIAKNFIYSFFTAIAVVFVLYFLTLFFFNLLINNPQYNEARKYLIFFLGGGMFHWMYYNFVNLLFFYEKTKVISSITISTGIVSIILMFILIKPFGLYATALVFVFNRLLIFILCFILSLRYVRLPWKNAFRSIINDLHTFKLYLYAKN